MKQKPKDKNVALFERYYIRRMYDEGLEKWLFSVVDILGALLDQADHRKSQSYWTTLKGRLKMEGSQLVTKCDQLKMMAADGKFYKTDVADTETILRLIQSVPSPKAEPFKLWLAKVGYERMQEIANPKLATSRMRLMGKEMRNKLTDYWSSHGIKKEQEFAILTNLIHQEWAGISVQKHKKLKGLGKQNLRDHMNEAEVIFTALAEMATRHIAEHASATGLQENIKAGKSGGLVSKKAKGALESRLTKPYNLL